MTYFIDSAVLEISQIFWGISFMGGTVSRKIYNHKQSFLMGFLWSLRKLKIGKKIMGFVTTYATWRLMLNSTLRKPWLNKKTELLITQSKLQFKQTNHIYVN